MLFSWYSSGTHPIQTVSLGFLAYNTVAFGLQPVIGYLCDTYRKIPAGMIGGMLLIVGLLFLPYPAVSILLMGLGNACFHIEGGIDSLRHSGGKMARSGIFVSSGALGVAFGGLAGKSGAISAYHAVGILLLCLVLIYVFCRKHAEPEDTIAEDTKSGHTKPEEIKPAFSIIKPGLSFGIVILLAAVSIIIRSYAGAILPMDWRTTPTLFVFPAIGAFLGKASGGLLADRIGARKLAVSSLLVALFLLTFGYTDPWVCLTGILFFNMSMAVTLCAIASVLPLNPGLSFGITTLALLCGNVPTFFVETSPAPPIFAALTAISMVCLGYILKGKVKNNEQNNAKNQ